MGKAAAKSGPSVTIKKSKAKNKKNKGPDGLPFWKKCCKCKKSNKKNTPRVSEKKSVSSRHPTPSKTKGKKSSKKSKKSCCSKLKFSKNKKKPETKPSGKSTRSKSRAKKKTFCKDFQKQFALLRKFPFGKWLLMYIFAWFYSIGAKIFISKSLKEHGDPACLEGKNTIYAYFFITWGIILLAPIGMILLWFHLAEKIISSLYWALLALCAVYAFSGVVNTISYLALKPHDRELSMIEYSKDSFFASNGYSDQQFRIEMKFKCCGITDFLDYPMEILKMARVPDHCCTVGSKGCGINIFYNTPLNILHRVDVSEFEVAKLGGCKFKTEVPAPQIYALINDGVAKGGIIKTLTQDFSKNGLSEDQICDDFNLGNYRDAMCNLTLSQIKIKS